MKTAQERETAFRRDLAELLEKHEAEIEVTDDHKPYGQHQGICVVTMMSKWDDDGNQTHDYSEFRL